MQLGLKTGPLAGCPGGQQGTLNQREPLVLLTLNLQVPLSPAQLQLKGIFYSSQRVQIQLLFH